MDKKERDDSARQAELSELFERLRGNQAFRSLRAVGDQSFANWMSFNLKDSQSITTADKNAEQLCEHFLVVNRILAQLRNAGKVHAEEEMFRALNSKEYIMEGEAFDIADVASHTLYVLEPDKTFRIIEFLRTHGMWLRGGWRVGSNVEDCAEAVGLFRTSLPSLEKSLELTLPGNDQRFDVNLALMTAYVMDVICKFPALDVLHMADDFVNPGGIEPLARTRGWEHYDITPLLEGFDPTGGWKTHTKLFPAFAFFVKGTRQKTLEALGDPEGQRVAAWEFSLPSWLPEKLDQFSHSAFGFFGPEKFEQERKLFPALTGDAMSHGLGAHLVGNLKHQSVREYGLFLG